LCYLQVEHQLQLIIDLQISAALRSPGNRSWPCYRRAHWITALLVLMVGATLGGPGQA
jgi:cytochrome c oxidase assembly factor CtaG